MGDLAQFRKSNCGVDEIAQYDLAGLHVTGKKVLDSFPEKRLAETRITFYARPDGFLEISCQSHWQSPSCPFSLLVVLPPSQCRGDVFLLTFFRPAAN